MSLAPRWLYDVSRVNPLAHVVDAERAIIAGHWTATSVWLGPLVAVALAAVCLAWGVRVFRRHSVVANSGFALTFVVLAIFLYCDRDLAPVFGHLSPLAGAPHR